MSYLNPVRNITFDAHDPYALAQFWSTLTGYALEGSTPDDDDVLISSNQTGVPGLLFLRVPEGKTVKNRIHHLDIQPPSGTRDAEVERLLSLGAKVVDDRRTDDGLGWVVMADPEGNEFCVERSAVERGLVEPM